MRKKLNLALATTLVAVGISAASAEAGQRPSFEGVDVNADDLISQAEFAALPHNSRQNAQNLFARLDDSGDGFIDRDELNQARSRQDLGQRRPRLIQLDADGDQRVSKAEFAAKTRQSRRDPEKIFAWLDLDGDGYLSHNELSRARQKHKAHR